jgi:hypothetical protein
MRHRFFRFGIWSLILGGTALGSGVVLSPSKAPAAQLPALALPSEASEVTQIRIYRRGRTPIYPYYYNPGRPGGYSFYFGFVPYTKGNVENEAIQRWQQPQNIEWPPRVNGGPRPGWGPKAWD